MILAPASSCIIRPDVTIGEMPSSIRVPGEYKVNGISLAASISKYNSSTTWAVDF